MSFQYYRILIVFLTAFAAFFAYIARLNLSLAIKEMVVLDKPEREDLDALQYKIIGQADETVPLIATEDHALASYSRSLTREIWHSRTRPKLRALFSKRKSPSAPTSRISPPTINFDIGRTRFPYSDDKQKDSQTNQPSIEKSIETLEVETEKVDEDKRLPWSEVPSSLDMLSFKYLVQDPLRYSAPNRLGASFCSFAFPMAAKLTDSIILVYIVRFILGATQAALFPATYVLFCHWLPKQERSKWLPWPSSFSRVGTISMYLGVPSILYNYGWEAVFYFSGTAALLWCLTFIILGSNTPSSSRWISQRELLYIESFQEPSLASLSQAAQKSASGFTINQSAEPEKPSIDWWKVISNKAALILSVIMFSSEWANMILLVKLPGFLGPVLNMNVAEIGRWSSVFVAIYCIQFPLSGWCASKLETSNIKGLTSLRVRKLFEISSQAMQGVGCLIIAYSSNKTVILAALSLMMLGRSTVGGGQCLMPPELSRDYPGTVFAYSNSIANLAGIIGPMTVTWMVDDCRCHASWSNLFLLSAGLFFVAGLLFFLFGDNEPQDYCRTLSGFANKNNSLSEACLTDKPRDLSDLEKIYKMDAFQRLGKEPPKEPQDSVIGQQLEGRVDMGNEI